MKILYYVSSLFQPFGKAFESTLNQGLKSFDGAFKGVRQMIGGKSGVRSQGIKSLDGAFEDVRQMLGGKSGVRDQGIKSFDESFEGVRQMIGGKSGVRSSVRDGGAGGKSFRQPCLPSFLFFAAKAAHSGYLISWSCVETGARQKIG